MVYRYSVSKVKNGNIGRDLQGKTAGQRGARASTLSARSSSASSANWRRPSVCWRATAKARGQERWPQPGRRSRQQRWLLQRDQAGARALRPRNQLAASAAHRASAIRSLPWQAVRRSWKSPLHARALAQIMLAPPFPGTSAPAVSKSATGNSLPRSRRLTSHSQGARNEGRRNRCNALGKGFSPRWD